MASEKPSMILKSKADMTSEEISALSDAEAWKVIYSSRQRRAKDNRLHVCFTGFGLSKKQELANLALVNRFKDVYSVTKKLDYLVGGDNAGPKKCEGSVTRSSVPK